MGAGVGCSGVASTDSVLLCSKYWTPTNTATQRPTRNAVIEESRNDEMGRFMQVLYGQSAFFQNVHISLGRSGVTLKYRERQLTLLTQGVYYASSIYSLMRSLRAHIRAFFHLDESYTPVEKVQAGVIVVIQLVFLGAIVLSIYEQAWLSLFVCVLALLALWLPSLFARNFRVHMPLEFAFILNLFIYGSIFLGELRGFYTRFWWWDVILHTGSGVALGIIGFLILYAFYRAGRFQASPILIALFSFSFALAIGSLWEIFEFAMDSLFGFNMQKSGLVDTMWDMIVNAIGAFVASLFGYVYVRRQRHVRRAGILDRMLHKVFHRRPRR